MILFPEVSTAYDSSAHEQHPQRDISYSTIELALVLEDEDDMNKKHIESVYTAIGLAHSQYAAGMQSVSETCCCNSVRMRSL